MTRQLLLAYRNRGIAAADALTAQACAPLFETDDLAHGIESLLASGRSVQPRQTATAVKSFEGSNPPSFT